MNIVLKTERLILTPLGIKYLESTHKYASDIETTQYMLNLPNDTIKQTRNFLQQVEEEWKKDKPTYYEFAIILDNIHIGAISIHFNDDYTIGELAWILNKQYQKKGYALEAALCIKDYAKNTLKLHSICAHCDYNNKSSSNLMTKLGMVLVDEKYRQNHNGNKTKEYKYELIFKEELSFECIIRTANKDELEQVNKLRKQVNDLHCDNRPDIFRSGWRKELQEHIYEIWENKNTDVIVVIKNNIIVGYACVAYVNNPIKPHYLERNYYYIDEFGVDLKYRRQGIATTLFNYLKTDAKNKGYSKIELDVWNFNKNAILFYEKMGFNTYRQFMELNNLD